MLVENTLKERSIINTKTLTRTGVLLAIAVSVQSLHLPTYITGPSINAVLIVAAIFTGILGGSFIGCITPLMALTMGIVHPVAVPLVPVIMIANCTLVVTFYLLKNNNHYIALIAASFAKFFVFYIALNYLIKFIDLNIPAPMLVAFQLPQLVTALVGGLAGVAIAKYLERVEYLREQKGYNNQTKQEK